STLLSLCKEKSPEALETLPGRISCRWPDSNRHGLIRLILSQVRLPIPPQRPVNRELSYHNSRLSASLFSESVLFLRHILQELFVNGEAVERRKIILRRLRPADQFKASVLFQKDLGRFQLAVVVVAHGKSVGSRVVDHKDISHI